MTSNFVAYRMDAHFRSTNLERVYIERSMKAQPGTSRYDQKKKKIQIGKRSGRAAHARQNGCQLKRMRMDGTGLSIFVIVSQMNILRTRRASGTINYISFTVWTLMPIMLICMNKGCCYHLLTYDCLIIRGGECQAILLTTKKLSLRLHIIPLLSLFFSGPGVGRVQSNIESYRCLQS